MLHQWIALTQWGGSKYPGSAVSNAIEDPENEVPVSLKVWEHDVDVKNWYYKLICSFAVQAIFFLWLSANPSGFLSPVCKTSLAVFCRVPHKEPLKIDSFLFENCYEDESCSINSAYCSSGLLISKAARVKVVGDWFKWKSRHSVADAGVRQNMFNQQQPEREWYREMIHKALQYHKVAHKINLITAFCTL